MLLLPILCLISGCQTNTAGSAVQDFCLVVTPHTYLKAQLGAPDGMAQYIKDIDMKWESLCGKRHGADF